MYAPKLRQRRYPVCYRYTAAGVCPERWTALTAEVRMVYSGLVSAAFLSNVLEPEAPKYLGYAKDFDFLGVDCYSGPGSGLPSIPYGPVNYSHPVSPWHDVDLDTLKIAKRTLISQ